MKSLLQLMKLLTFKKSIIVLKQLKKQIRWNAVVLVIFCSLMLLYVRLKYGVPVKMTVKITKEEELHLQCNQCTEEQNPLIINNMWHKINQKDIEVNIGKIYLDNRLPKTPLISTHVVTNVNKSIFSTESINLFCHFWIETTDNKLDVIYSKVHVIAYSGGDAFRISGTAMYQYIISCVPPKDIMVHPVDSVSISFLPCHNLHKQTLTYLDNLDQPTGASICAPPLYANFLDDDRELTAFIEWIEIYQILGISEFFMYNVTLTFNAQLDKILQYYKEKGVVTWIDFPSPVNHDKSQLYHATKLTMSAALADCMLRNVNRKYVLIVDIDDIIFPRKHTDLLSYLNSEFTEAIHTLKVYKHDFFLDYPASGDSMDPLITSRYFYLSPTSLRWKFKSVVNPRKCVVPYEHECRITTDRYLSFKRASLHDVVLHHYRRSCYHTHLISDAGKTNHNSVNEQQFAKCQENLGNLTFKDTIALTFRDKLLYSVSQVISDLNFPAKYY